MNQFKDKEYVWIMGTYGEFRDDGEEMTHLYEFKKGSVIL